MIVNLDRGVRSRIVCEAPYRYTYGLTLFVVSIFSRIGGFWLLIALAVASITGHFRTLIDSIREGFILALIMSPSFSNKFLGPNGQIGDSFELFITWAPYIFALLPIVVPALTLALLVVARSAWRAIEHRRILLPSVLVLTGVPFFIARDAFSIFTEGITGSVSSLPTVTFAIATEWLPTVVFAREYFPLAAGIANWAACAIAVSYCALLKLRGHVKGLRSSKQSARFDMTKFGTHDWVNAGFFVAKFLLVSPLHTIFSWPFLAYIVAVAVAGAMDSDYSGGGFERQLGEVAPFAIATAIAAAFLLMRIVRSSINSMADLEAFMRQMYQGAARSADEVSIMDHRPPIVFLRTFADDEAALDEVPPLPQVLWRQLYRKRIEEILADVAWDRGPLIALNDPRVKLSPLGAAKNIVFGEEWREEILRYIDLAGVVIVLSGKGTSLAWELEQIAARGHLGKTLFVLLPRISKENVSVIGLIREDLSPRPCGQAAEAGFLKGPTEIAFTSEWANGRAYAELIRVAAEKILRNR